MKAEGSRTGARSGGQKKGAVAGGFLPWPGETKIVEGGISPEFEMWILRVLLIGPPPSDQSTGRVRRKRFKGKNSVGRKRKKQTWREKDPLN